MLALVGYISAQAGSTTLWILQTQLTAAFLTICVFLRTSIALLFMTSSVAVSCSALQHLLGFSERWLLQPHTPLTRSPAGTGSVPEACGFSDWKGLDSSCCGELFSLAAVLIWGFLLCLTLLLPKTIPFLPAHSSTPRPSALGDKEMTFVLQQVTIDYQEGLTFFHQWCHQNLAQGTLASPKTTTNEYMIWVKLMCLLCQQALKQDL